MTREPGKWQRRSFQVVMPIEGITLALLLVSSPVGVPLGAAIVYVLLLVAVLLAGLVASIIGCFGQPRSTWAVPSALLHAGLIGTATLWRPVASFIDGMEDAREYRSKQAAEQQQRLASQLAQLLTAKQFDAARAFLEQHDELRLGYRPALHQLLCAGGGEPAPALLRLAQKRGAPSGGDLLLEAAQCSLPAFKAVAHELGIEPVTLAQNGRSPLTKAIDQEVLSYLLGLGVDVNARDKQGATPLMYHRNVQVTRFLLQHGADVKATDQGGRSALHYSAPPSEAPSIYTALLDAGADVNLEDASGQTALLTMRRTDAYSPWVQSAADVLVAHGARGRDRVKVISSLLDHPEDANSHSIPLAPCLAWTDLDLAGAGGASLLITALSGRQTEVVEQLLALGANPSAHEETGNSALGYWESTYGKSDPPEDTYRMLLEAAARYAAAVTDGGG